MPVDLDAVSIEDAQVPSLEERDALLDLIIADWRRRTTDLDSHSMEVYWDYPGYDFTRRGT